MLTETMEGFRLSLQQERLWLLQQQTSSTAYCVQGAVLIEGDLDMETLQAALQTVGDRHEILRTTFYCAPGMKIPVQVITDRAVHLGQANPRESQVEAIFRELRQRSLNFEQGALLQTVLITYSPDRHLLLLSLPALGADTATLRNLVQELGHAYTACLQAARPNNDSPLPDEPLQYVDFSEWQSELLEAAETEMGRAYWRRQNLSALHSLKLPYAKQTATTTEFDPQVLSATLDPNFAEKIDAIASHYNTSASTFLLACWEILLWRLTEQTDLVVGTACDGRKYAELETALGLFAKYLPLQTHIDANLSFGQLLAQLDDSIHQINQWQECFTWELVTGLDANADIPTYPFCFEFDELTAKYTDSNFSFSLAQHYSCIEPFQIKLSCWRRDGMLNTEFHYDASLLATEAIQRLAEQFHQLVESVIRHPETAISQLEILSDRARHQLLVEFNQTQAHYPIDLCIHHLFEAQAERTPNHIAVTFESQQLTYAELNTRANQLAHHLQQLGVKPETLVGLCLERSLEMAIGILGIIKAGGAYLPLDPTYPPERLAFILKDSQISLLLTQQKLRPIEATTDRFPQLPYVRGAEKNQDFEPQQTAPSGGGLGDAAVPQWGVWGASPPKIACLYLDQDHPQITQQPTHNPISNTKPENLAYIIYTSGSTGNPKGVQISHRNLVHSTQARITYYQQPITRFLLLSSFAFDSSIAGIFWTLCQGGTLCLPPEGLQREVPQIVEAIAHHQISHLLSLPSLYALLLKQATPKQLTSLRTIIVAGEACPPELVRQHLELQPKTSLFNEYGPTEATVWSSVYHCHLRERSQIPIGYPIANTQIYLLDSHLQPVPIGVSGELYISGDGLARGYLNRPELTAEKFIPNPFSNQPGARLYKTGDVARYQSDGNIEFLGRIDGQVKIRGFRVELGEIEAALRQHPAVRETAVLVREDVPGDQRLVAYIVPTEESKSLSGTQGLAPLLRQFLQDKLPDYMVPSAFVLLKSLPLTPNGKVDRRSLPAPDQVRPELAANYVAPRTSVEQKLAQIWSKILGIEQVGVHDNFFDLGGHSLLTTQLLAQVRDALQVEVSLRSLLEIPTIAGLAENIEKLRQPDPLTPVPPITSIDLETEAVLDPTIRPQVGLIEPAHTPRRALLTGATGFLGAFLLVELLQQTQATIYCLVRSRTPAEGQQRIQTSLKSYDLWHETFSTRIIPVVGDLSQPLLGLSEPEFEKLASQIDVIYHNGAWVNFTYPYSALKAANVLGTQEVLRLACQTKVKPVHFISTTSVFSSAGYSGVRVLHEQDQLNQNEVLASNGYAQSKWVAERLVAIARERGLPVSIYRPGRIAGHSQTGACNPGDLMYRAIIGCLELGSAPDVDVLMNVAPIDYVSQAIAHLSLQPDSPGKVFHLTNPQLVNWRNMVRWLRSFGYPLKSVSYEQWREALLNLAESSLENALSPVVPLFSERESESTTGLTTLQFDCHNTLASLAGTSIACPAIDAALLQTYCSYLAQRNLLKISSLGINS